MTMTSIAQSAVNLAEDGFWIFPCRPGTKIPAVKGYLTAKWTTDDVRSWWKDHPNDNIGINPEINHLVVIDVDAYKDECNWDRGALSTMSVKSPSGGMHYYFDAEDGARYPGKFGGYKAVDVKHRGVVVLPPSKFESGSYAWHNDLSAEPAPDWLPTKGKAAAHDDLDVILAGMERGTDDAALRSVEAATNTIPDREDWIKIGLALHFEYARTRHEDRARQAWIDWCLRWDGDTADRLEEAAIKLWDAAADPLDFLASGRKPYTAGTILFLLGRPKPEAVDMKDDFFLEIDGDALLTKELADIDFLVDDFLIAGGLHSWAGPSGVGKTRYVSLLIACLMTGRTDVMGLPPANRPIRTMYFANEERAEDIERRIKAAMHANGLTGGTKPLIRGKENGSTRLVVNDQGQYVQNEAFIDGLIERIKDSQTELVIFDPFNTLGGEEENSAASVSEVMDAMRAISSGSGAAVAFIHHTPKDRTEAPDAMRGDSSAWRGSGAIFSALDMGFTLFPLLPSSCSTGKEAKAKRRSLKTAQDAGSCGKYIAQDTAKVREGESLSAVAFKFVGHEVRPGGKPIGALQAVRVADAEADMSAAVEVVDVIEEAAAPATDGAGAASDVADIGSWGGPLITAFGIGKHFATLVDINRIFDGSRPKNWKTADRLYSTRGQGKRLVDLFAAGPRVDGHFVKVTKTGSDTVTKTGVWVEISKEVIVC